MANLINTIKRTIGTSIKVVTTTVEVTLDAVNTTVDGVDYLAGAVRTQGIKSIGKATLTGAGYTADLLTDSDIGTLEAKIEALQAKSQKELFEDIQSLIREDT